MSVLSRVKLPKDLKKLSFSELQKLNDELRDYTIEVVSKTGGHLGASLGVVELTVALHYVFNAPSDKIIWDVGHQTYPHKILTGRKNKIHSLRKKMEYLVLLKDQRVYMTLLVQHIVQLQSLLALESQLRGTY